MTWSTNKYEAVTAQVCAGGDARVCRGWGGAVRAHAHGSLPSVLQFRRCVYIVGVTYGGLLARVMSKLAPITLGRDDLMNDLS